MKAKTKEKPEETIKRIKKWFRSLTPEQQKTLHAVSKKHFKKMGVLSWEKKPSLSEEQRADKFIWHSGDVIITKRPKISKKLVRN